MKAPEIIIRGEKVIQSEPVTGGSISAAHRLETESGVRYFCKSSTQPTSLFIEEAAGLKEIAEIKSIRCPQVIEADEHKIVMEWFQPEDPTPEFWRLFGRKLARMHIQLQESYGFPIHNHIGTTPQSNPLKSVDEISWADWFMEHRLKALLAHSTFNRDAELGLLFKRAEPLIKHRLAAVTEPPSLLHGDLWNGNFLCAPEQTPVLIDPAPYFGHREADLAMTELFGGFDPEFYKSYAEEFPLQPGYELRKGIYNLYHLLNHWILFGTTYRTPCLDILTSLLVS